MKFPDPIEGIAVGNFTGTRQAAVASSGKIEFVSLTVAHLEFYQLMPLILSLVICAIISLAANLIVKQSHA